MDIALLVLILLVAAGLLARPPLRPRVRVPDHVPAEWTRTWQEGR